MPEYPPNCGQRFAYLLETNDGSRGIGQPCGTAAIIPEIFGDAWVCQASDLEVAQARVEQVAELISAAFANLLEAEDPGHAWYEVTATPIADSWLTEVAAWEEKVADLSPIIINPLGLEQYIVYRWNLVAEGACLLDALDTAAQNIGGDAIPEPHIPDPPPDPTPIADAGKGIGVALGVVAALGLGVVIWKASSK